MYTKGLVATPGMTYLCGRMMASENNFCFTSPRTQHCRLYHIVTLPDFLVSFFTDMPPKKPNSSKEELYPKLTSTLTLKWDVAKTGKVILITQDGPIVLLGFSVAAHILKFANPILGPDAAVRTLAGDS